jgi:excisionase family DNA binding protein
MTRPFLSSADVATALGVGVSTVKRWTDEGELATLKTVGGHRRYQAAAVREFAKLHGFDASDLPADSPPRERTLSPSQRSRALLEALRSGRRERIRRAVGATVTAEEFDLFIGVALETIGVQWSEGNWRVDEEHRASYALAEVIDEQRPPAQRRREKEGRRALLAAPPGEMHELPLRMVRVLLERDGWTVDFLGADVPWEGLRETVKNDPPRLLLLTARSAAPFRQKEFVQLVKECSRRKTIVGVGGSWARGGSGAELETLRFRSLRGFERWLRSADAPA